MASRPLLPQTRNRTHGQRCPHATSAGVASDVPNLAVGPTEKIRVRHPFWDTMNNGTPVLRRPRADCHHSWTVGRPRETNMVHQPRAGLASSTKSRS